MFAWPSACSFLKIPEYPRPQWFAVSMLWVWRALAYLLIAFASCCSGPGSRYTVHLITAGLSLNAAPVVTVSACRAPALATDFQGVTPIPQSSGSNTTNRPIQSELRKTIQQSLCKLTAVTPTLQSSIWGGSAHHIQVPHSAMLDIFLAHSLAAFLAVASSSSIVVLTAAFSAGSGQYIVFTLVLPTCSIIATLPTGAPGVW